MELGVTKPGPSPLYIDNEVAFKMIKEKRPTPRARHIEIQHFAIQEWHDALEIQMRHIPGIINSSDDLTKALGWVLHARHARRSMGHFGIGSLSRTPNDLLTNEAENSESGRVLGPDSVPTRAVATVVSGVGEMRARWARWKKKIAGLRS